MSIDPIEQKKWIERCLAGDSRSQQRLFETFYSKMLGVCMRYASDSDQAKDILQEGFIKAFKSLDNFDHKGSLEGWIRRIMVNTAIDRIRKEKRSLVLSRSEEMLDQAIELSDDGLGEMEEEGLELNMTHVVEAMHQLSPAYQTVFNLYVMEDMTHKEIADRLGISEGTSKSNLSKAKMNLKKILSKRQNDTQ